MSDRTCPRCGAHCVEVPPLGATDSRDIEIKILNASCEASEIVRQFEGKYKLRNYRVPIESVTVQCDPNFFLIIVGLYVLDVGNGCPIRLTVEKSYPRWMLESDLRGTKGFFEQCLRQAFQWTHNHELDECFVCDGQFVTDPHPDERPKLPPPIRTGNSFRDAMANNRGIHTNS